MTPSKAIQESLRTETEFDSAIDRARQVYHAAVSAAWDKCRADWTAAALAEFRATEAVANKARKTATAAAIKAFNAHSRIED
jgi:hypothetical protein